MNGGAHYASLPVIASVRSSLLFNCTVLLMRDPACTAFN